MPLSKTFYVGTDCGIAVSHDNGATWSNFILDPSVTGLLMHRVRSVLVINRSSGVAASDRGLFFLNQSGTWQKAQDVNTSGQVPVLHAFAAPFWGASGVFFHASGGQKIHLSTNGGATWTQLNAPSTNNREAFVRVSRSLSGDDTRFDVYYGDGASLNRQEFTFSPLQGSGSWFRQKVDHADPSDIVFDLERRIPVMLATDGGVHVTSTLGAVWTLTGGGPGGFTALQVSEMTGQLVSGPNPHLDLYYATQDNDIKSSSDGGHTWTGSICCEGRTLRVDPTSNDHDGSGVTGLSCGGCGSFISNAHFENVRGWPNASGNTVDVADAPFHITKNSYLQFATNVTTMPPRFDGFLTIDAGSNWRKAFTLPNRPMGASMFSGSLVDPTAYQAVELSGSPPGGGTRWGLFRIQNVAGAATVTQIDTAGIDAFGSVRTPISRRAVVGVDPGNPNRLIAADVADEAMKFSADAGTTWFALPKLTQAVTDNGNFLFTVGDLSLPTVIGWDPYDSCHILVGTTQNGVIRSTNGGNTWTKIPGSSRVTLVSSFYFPPTGPVWVSTNGRGLWNLELTRQTGPNTNQCRFPRPPVGGIPVNDLVFIDPTTGAATQFAGPEDPRVCPQCALVVVRNGWVTEVQQADGRVRDVAISGGTIYAIDRNGREVVLPIANRYKAGDGRMRFGRMERSKMGSRRIRALVLEGNRVIGVIATGGELPFAPARTPLVFALNASRLGASGVLPGESPRVIGTNFVPPSRGGQAVRITIGDEVVARDVQVREDGSFSVDVAVRQLPGEWVVTVEQQDGNRLTVARTNLEVLRKEEK